MGCNRNGRVVSFFSRLLFLLICCFDVVGPYMESIHIFRAIETHICRVTALLMYIFFQFIESWEEEYYPNYSGGDGWWKWGRGRGAEESEGRREERYPTYS